jgi:hypothetical protein
MRFVEEVKTVGSSLLDILEVSCSGILFLAAVVSVSMSTVLRGAKKVASEH